MKKHKNTGIKLTHQRNAIIDYLKCNKEHPSAEDIHRVISKKFPSISLATVYNTLKALGANGKISALTIDPAKKRYEPHSGTHHHMICVKCKNIVDINKEFKLSIPYSMTEDFNVIGNHIEFYGICPECKNRLRCGE